VLLVAIVAAVTVTALASSAAGGRAAPARPSAGAVVVWAVGDGPNPKQNKRAKQVSDMIMADHPSAVLYLGDVYEKGTKKEFKQYYKPTFGRFSSITYPTPGNHELESSPPLSGYDGYWTKRRPAVVGPGASNTYAADLGAGWRALGLTSSFPGEGTGPSEEDTKGGPNEADELKFIAGDLAAHTGTCYLPFWHRPRFSAGSHGDQVDMDPVYQLLNGRTPLLLNGHEHEFFRLDLSKVVGANPKLPGAQEIVAGTAGVRVSKTIHTGYPGLVAYLVAPNKAAKKKKHYYGALRLVLTSGQATFEYRDLDGSIIDRGSVGCAPVAPG